MIVQTANRLCFREKLLAKRISATGRKGFCVRLAISYSWRSPALGWHWTASFGEQSQTAIQLVTQCPTLIGVEAVSRGNRDRARGPSFWNEMDRGRVFISLRKPVILSETFPKGLSFATQDRSWCAFVGETTALCRELHNARS